MLPPTLNPLGLQISQLRRRRRASGLCAEAGCKRKSGEAYRCPEHAAKSAKRVAKHRKLQEQRARPSWR